MTYDISEIDASKVVGHTVKTFIPVNRIIDAQRDIN